MNKISVLNDTTEKIIGCSFNVINSLGNGFLEKVYENSLSLELRQTGLKVVQQKPIQVEYRKQIVGEYIADLLVEDEILVELKAVQSLEEVHFAQCLNYLKATGFPICMLLNFGRPELQFRRISARKEWGSKKI
jgi:GxxExxY protein